MKPRDIGTRAETAVVRYLRDHGWPHAERRALRGNQDAGDITGTPGVCWSVKAGEYARQPSDRQVAQWLAELETQRVNAGAAHGLLITRRHRTGDPGHWWAYIPAATLTALVDGRPAGGAQWVVTPLWQAVGLLRSAGYGDPLPEGATAR